MKTILRVGAILLAAALFSSILYFSLADSAPPSAGEPAGGAAVNLGAGAPSSAELVGDADRPERGDLGHHEARGLTAADEILKNVVIILGLTGLVVLATLLIDGIRRRSRRRSALSTG